MQLAPDDLRSLLRSRRFTCLWLITQVRTQLERSTRVLGHKLVLDVGELGIAHEEPSFGVEEDVGIIRVVGRMNTTNWQYRNHFFGH